MATKTTLEKLSPAGKKVHADVLKTMSVPVLTAVVKEAINVRDHLLGKDSFEFDHEPTLAKVKDPNSRKRAKALLAAVAKLEERKDVSIICAAAITQRKVARAKKTEKPAKSSKGKSGKKAEAASE